MIIIMKNINKLVIEICNHCGHDVSFGSGRFINRVPDFNDALTRIKNNILFPCGDFLCEECDIKLIDGRILN